MTKVTKLIAFVIHEIYSRFIFNHKRAFLATFIHYQFATVVNDVKVVLVVIIPSYFHILLVRLTLISLFVLTCLFTSLVLVTFIHKNSHNC